MSQIEHLAQFHFPGGGLARNKAKVINWNTFVYVCCGSKFVYVFSMEEKKVMTTYVFPSKIWHIELDKCRHQLYVLCDQSGLFLLDFDEQGRLLMDINPVMNKENMKIYHIGSSFVCLLDSSICSFILAFDFLVIVAVQQNKWILKLFHRTSLHNEDPRTSPSREVIHNFGPETSDLQPVLCCISLWKDNSVNEDPNSFAIDVSLFTRLFGVDLAVLETPMILCGFPDGQVICFPLKSTGVSFMHTSETHSLPQSSLKTIYQLKQPVVSIGAIRIEQCDQTGQQMVNSKNVSCDCVLFIGRQGLIVSVTSNDISEDIACAYKDYCLSVPLSCAFYSMAGVYCSTYSDLMFVTIPRVEKGTASTANASIVSSVCYNVPMIVAVSQNTSLSDELVILSTRGQLLLYKVHKKESTGRLEEIGSDNAGQKIKGLLSAIGSVSDRINKLKCTVNQKTSYLTKLNQVISLSRAVLSSRWTECPIHCTIRGSWNQMLQKDCLVAYCNLQNMTDCFLERGWTLCILINTDPKISYSFPIALKPMEKKELTFPLTTYIFDSLDFPIHIFFSLFYSLKDLGGNSTSVVSSLPYLHRQNVSILLQEHTIDFLQCLRFSSQTSFPTPSCSVFTLPGNFIERFLKSSFQSESSSNQLEAVHMAICNQDVNLAMPQKASIQVSAHQLAQALQNEQSGRPLCSAALQWLLFSAELTNVQDLVEVQGVTPDGVKFCLRVHEVTVSDLSYGNIPAIEIQILAFHLHAVASIHLAIINRLKLLFQENKANYECSFPNLILNNIHQQFGAFEMSLNEVKFLRDSFCMDEDTISSSATQRLLSIYKELRQSSSLLFI